jgi:hypothetical protein
MNMFRTLGLLLPLLAFVAADKKAFVFTLPDKEAIVRYGVALSSTGSDCTLSGVDNPNLVTFAGAYDDKSLEVQFTPTSSSKLAIADLKVLKKGGKIKKDGTVEYNLNPFSTSSEEEEIPGKFNVFVSRKKQVDLQLDFLSGSAALNLSGLALGRLDIRSGSADVDLSYGLSQPNTTPLDTCHVRADVGSIKINYVDHLNTKVLRTSAKYGKIEIGFSPLHKNEAQVYASIGAGRMLITLPNGEVPVILRLKKSRLANIKLPEDMERRLEGEYTNAHYYVNAPGVIHLFIEVNAGSVEIRYE